MVLARYGASVLLLLPNQQTLTASVRRRLEHITCGDQVEFETDTKDGEVVTSIATRKNVLQRADFRNKTKTLASNIDQIVIVTAIKPVPDWQLVDQLIVAGIDMGVEVLLLAHKSDLENSEDLHQTHDYYKKIGHKSLITSLHDPASLESLDNQLTGKTNILVGQSGMGKSTLANYLIEHSEIKIGALSESSGHGQHTTSVAQCYPLGEDAYLIDSPGVRDFTATALSANQVSAGFLEIHEAAARCKFNDCRHQQEPACAVREQFEQGLISQQRMDSFARLLKQQSSL